MRDDYAAQSSALAADGVWMTSRGRHGAHFMRKPRPMQDLFGRPAEQI